MANIPLFKQIIEKENELAILYIKQFEENPFSIESDNTREFIKHGEEAEVKIKINYKLKKS